jgi:hypothetical protein
MLLSLEHLHLLLELRIRSLTLLRKRTNAVDRCTILPIYRRRTARVLSNSIGSCHGCQELLLTRGHIGHGLAVRSDALWTARMLSLLLHLLLGWLLLLSLLLLLLHLLQLLLLLRLRSKLSRWRWSHLWSLGTWRWSTLLCLRIPSLLRRHERLLLSHNLGSSFLHLLHPCLSFPGIPHIALPLHFDEFERGADGVIEIDGVGFMNVDDSLRLVLDN